jgi:hypothetical protein
MTLEDLIRLARIRLRAKTDQTLWTDEDLTEFANSAVEEACIRARLLETDTIIPVIAGQETYDLPYPIYKIEAPLFLEPNGALVSAGNFTLGKWYQVATPGNTSFITIGAADDLAGTYFKATGVGAGTGNAKLCTTNRLSDLSQSKHLCMRATDTSTGNVSSRPLYFVRNSSSIQVSILPISNVVGALVLHGRRLPGLRDIMVNPQDEPVIPQEFHRDLVHWMLAEAYNVHDSDALDPKAAEKYEAKFEARFGKRPSAKAEAHSLRAPIGGDIVPRKFGSSRPC